jgi:hypothetical protein
MQHLENTVLHGVLEILEICVLDGVGEWVESVA